MNPNRIAFAPILLVTLSFVFLHGCGGEPTTFPASGTVKFADGTPLVGALVEFQLAENTAAPTAKGSTGADVRNLRQRGRRVSGSTYGYDHGSPTSAER
ncbi:MAG: hypothetical protein MKZ95_16075 [Pirellulales bacterium]|nr:hypothetical protein [Pirellulales bacterium]